MKTFKELREETNREGYKPLDESVLNSVFQSIYKAVGKALDAIPVVRDKREEKRIIQKRNHFVNTMTPAKNRRLGKGIL